MSRPTSLVNLRNLNCHNIYNVWFRAFPLCHNVFASWAFRTANWSNSAHTLSHCCHPNIKGKLLHFGNAYCSAQLYWRALSTYKSAHLPLLVPLTEHGRYAWAPQLQSYPRQNYHHKNVQLANSGVKENTFVHWLIECIPDIEHILPVEWTKFCIHFIALNTKPCSHSRCTCCHTGCWLLHHRKFPTLF